VPAGSPAPSHLRLRTGTHGREEGTSYGMT
jgi:hypothetical protein